MSTAFVNPEEYLVRATASDYGVDPDTAARIAHTESGFDQNAVSPKGARGVMQLMPGTAQDLGVDPSDLAQNIDGGVRYYKQLLDRFGGDERKAAAAYNAGPGRVESGKPLPDETKAYVDKVAPVKQKFADPEYFLKQGATPDQPAANFADPEAFLKQPDALQPAVPVSQPASPVPGMERLGGAAPPIAGSPIPAALQSPAVSAPAAPAPLAPGAVQVGSPQIQSEEPPQKPVGPAFVTPYHADVSKMPVRSQDPGLDVWGENVVNAIRQGKIVDAVKEVMKTPVDMEAVDQQLSNFLVGPFAVQKGVIESAIAAGTSPGNIVLAGGVGAAGKIAEVVSNPYVRATWETANTALAAAFAGNAAVGAYQNGKQAWDALNKGDFESAAKDLGFGTVDGLFAYLGARGAIAGGMDIKQGIQEGIQLGKFRAKLQDELYRREAERRATERAAVPQPLGLPAPAEPVGEAAPPEAGPTPDTSAAATPLEKATASARAGVEALSREPEGGTDVHSGDQGVPQSGEVPSSRGVSEGAPVATERAEPVRGLPEQGGSAPSQTASEPAAGDQRGDSGGSTSGQNTEDIVTGTLDPKLTEKGHQEAGQLGDNTSNTRVFVAGPKTRTLETAGHLAEIAGPDAHVIESPAMGPWNLGSFQGKPQGQVDDQINEFIAKKPGEAVPGGESFDAYKARPIGEIQAQAKDWRPGQRVVNVTHSIGVQTIDAWLKNGAPADQSIDTQAMLDRAKVEPGALLRIDPRTMSAEFVKNTKQDGIYVTRHAETPLDNIGANGQPAAEQKFADPEEFLAKPEEVRHFSSTQVNVPPELAGAAKTFANTIRQEDLAGDGRETEPHVTVKYGLHDTDAGELKKLLKGEGPVQVTFGKTSIFPASEATAQHGGPKYDVVKVDVNSPDLHRLNSKIARLPHTDTHPVYQPHLTLGYVKAGSGQKYADKEVPGLTGQSASLKSLLFSSHDNTREAVPLDGAESPAATIREETEPAGSKAQVYTTAGRTLNVGWDVREAADLRNSFEPDYPQEYQPRDTGRIGSRQRVEQRKADMSAPLMSASQLASDGAPIIQRDGTVITRNHGTQALKELYAEGNPRAAGYKNWIASHAGEFGLKPETVSAMKQPVLVRAMTDKLPPSEIAQFAREANMSSAARMSDAELGASLGQKLTGTLMDAFDPTEDGRPNPEFVRELIRDLPVEEQAVFMDREGHLSQSGARIIRNAIFSKAYPDPRALERMAESESPTLKNLTSGMLAAAPKVAQLQESVARGDRFDLGIGKEIADAAEVMDGLIKTGTSLDIWLRQGDMYGRDPAMQRLVEIFSENRRSGRKIGEFLKEYTEVADAAGSPKQDALFGLPEAPQKIDVIEAAYQRAKERWEPQRDIFTEAGAEPARGAVASPSGSAAGSLEGVEPSASRAVSPLPSQPVAPTFYSQLQRTIADKMPNSAYPAHIKGIIDSPKSGVKPDEVKWSGLDDWLQQQQGKPVNKDQVLEFLRDNETNIVEKTHGADEGKFKSYTLPGGTNYREVLLTLPPKRVALRFEQAPEDTDTWTSSAIPGFPDSAGRFQIYRFAKRHPGFRKQFELYDAMDRKSHEVASLKEAQQTAEAIASVEKVHREGSSYKSAHWDEPNVLAHIRMDDRTGPDGKPVLMVEEIQSDWHQEGKRKGYKGEFERALTPDERELRDFNKRTWGGATEALSDTELQRAAELQKTVGVSLAEKANRLKSDIPEAPFAKSWQELAFRRVLRYAAENGYDHVAWTTGAQQAERYDLSKQIDTLQWDLNPDGSYDVVARKGGEKLIAKERLSAKELEDLVGKEMAKKVIDKVGADDKNSNMGRISGLDLKVGGSGMKGFYDKILPDYANKYGKKWGAKVAQSKIPTGWRDPRVLDTILREDFGTTWGQATPDQQQSAISVQNGEQSKISPARTARMKELLKEAEYLGFDSERQALEAVSSHDDWDRRWDVPAGELHDLLSGWKQRGVVYATVHSIEVTPAMRKSVMEEGQPLFYSPPKSGSLFGGEAESESQKASQSYEDRLLGERLTAQIKSGLPARPAKLKPREQTGLFEENAGEVQDSLFDSSKIPHLPDAERVGPFISQAPIRHHAQLAKFEPLPIPERYAKIVDGFVTNLSGMEMLGRMAARESDSVGPTHVGLHISPQDVPRIIRNAKALLGANPPAPAAKLLEHLRETSEAGKSAIFISDHKAWEKYQDTALAEELSHAVQASLTGQTRSHLAQSGVDLFRVNPLYAKASGTLNRYGEIGKQMQAVEIGARLMRPDGYKELGLTPDEARSLAADYVRALREEHGNKTARQIAREVFDAFRSRPTESGERVAGATSERGAGTSESAQPDLSGYRPGEQAVESRDSRDDSENTPAVPAVSKEVAPEKQEFSLFGYERGGVSPDLLTLGANKFIQEDIVPSAKRVASDLVGARDDIRRVVAPQLRGSAAEYTGLNLRYRMAQFARRFDQGEQRLRGARKFFSKRSPEDNYRFIDNVERGLGRGRKPGDAELEPIARMFSKMLDQRRTEVQALGEGALKGFYQYYFPHIFERPEAADKFIQTFFSGKRSMEGPKSFLQHRDFPTFQEAVEAGLKPVSDNPVDLVMIKAREMDRYLLAHAVLRDLAEKGVAKRVSGLGPDARQAELISGAPIRPEWAVEKREDLPPGFMSIRDPVGGGKWYAEEGAADVLNNFLSPGLRGRSGLFRTLLGVNNTMNQANLGLSAFHLRAVTISSMASRMGLGMVKAMQGHPVDAAWHMATSPAAPFIDYLKGSKVLREWFKPGSEGAPVTAMTDSLMKGGGRARMDAFYQNNVAEKMRAAFRSGNFVGGVIRSPFAAIEATSKPLMEFLVPRMKLGAFSDMAQHEMERLGPGASVEDVQRAMSDAWDHVENRLGQMTYDNRFWNRTFKDVAMLAVRSVGWNLGDFLETKSAIGAVKQAASLKKPTDLHGLGFVMGYTVVAAIMGAIMQYLHTGHGPDSLEDYFFPKREDGRRVVSAPYVKDAYQFAKDPARTIENKASPLITSVMQMVHNRDYYDRPIVQSEAPWYKQLQQEAEFIGRQFLPFTLQQEFGNQPKKKSLPGGDTKEHKGENFLGITPAPGALQPGYKPRHQPSK